MDTYIEMFPFSFVGKRAAHIRSKAYITNDSESFKTAWKLLFGDLIVIDTENLTKKFGNLTAVKDEVFGFLGPNGAGKTTTI